MGARLFLTPDSPASALSAYALVPAGLAGADVAALLTEASGLLSPAPAAAPRPSIGFALPSSPVAASAARPGFPSGAGGSSAASTGTGGDGGAGRSEGSENRPYAVTDPKGRTRAAMATAPIGGGPGIALGAAIAEAVVAGRDKVAIAADGTGIDLGAWIERLFAAEAAQVVPLLLERPSDWGHEGPDVLSITIGGALSRGVMPGGGIAPDLSVNGPLGAQLAAWEQAARVLGRRLGARSDASAGFGSVADPAGPDDGDEGVRALLDADDPGVRPALVEGFVEVYGETAATSLVDAIDELARAVPSRGLLAIAAYLDPAGDAKAAAVRDALAGRVDGAVSFGWGDRAAAPATALLQLTGAAAVDPGVPGRPYTFGGLQAARAASERRRAGGPLLRLHLTDRASGIEQLLAALGG
jgi:glucose-6-phosphate isomerase